MTEFPLITCLCLTKKRREWLPKAIDNFLAQEYAPRELVIVADGADDVAGLIPRYAQDYITCWLAPGLVGRKRNLGCREAKGELIAIWDDDDYSAPGRLRDQMAEFQRPDIQVTGYHAMKFTDGKQWWQYRGARSTVIATSLMFRKAWWEKHPFRDMQCGQDELFADIAASKKVLASVEDRDLMYATIHDGNTSRRSPERNNAFVPLPDDFAWSSAA